MSKIIIISLEGKESCTEKNFFRGMDYALEKGKIIIEGINQTISESDSKTKNLQNHIKKTIFRPNKEAFIGEKSEIYFIGDGDDQHNIQTMDSAKLIFINYMYEKFSEFEAHVNQESIIPKEKSFDRCLENIISRKGLNLPKCWKARKKSSCRVLFNEYAEAAKWFDGNKLNVRQIIQDFKDINVLCYNCIFEKILSFWDEK